MTEDWHSSTTGFCRTLGLRVLKTVAPPSAVGNGKLNLSVKEVAFQYLFAAYFPQIAAFFNVVKHDDIFKEQTGQ